MQVEPLQTAQVISIDGPYSLLRAPLVTSVVGSVKAGTETSLTKMPGKKTITGAKR